MGDLEELHSRGVNFVLISFVFVSANSKGSLFLTLSVLNFKIQDLVLSPNFYMCSVKTKVPNAGTGCPGMKSRNQVSLGTNWAQVVFTPLILKQCVYKPF